MVDLRYEEQKRLDDSLAVIEAGILAKRKKEMECDERKKIKLAIVPFKNDMYGVTEEFIDSLNSYCYSPQTLEILEWLDNNQIDQSKINDFHLTKAIKELRLNSITYGYIYTDTKENTYMPRPDWMSGSDNEIFGGIIKLMESKQEKRDKAFAGQMAGTWIYATIFRISENGDKVFLFKNNRFGKIY